MSAWGRGFAAIYDTAMEGAESAGLRAHRQLLVERVKGAVLEIGGGTGANLPFYGKGVTELVITEPEAPMARRCETKLKGHELPARVVLAAAEDLPFPAQSFDAVVATLVLCTVEDPARALAEVQRVLRPGGTLVFLEHVRAEEPRLARWQDRLHGVQVRLGHGCHCNRPTLQSILDAGFSVDELRHDRMRRTLPVLAPLIAGVATAAL